MDVSDFAQWWLVGRGLHELKYQPSSSQVQKCVVACLGGHEGGGCPTRDNAAASQIHSQPTGRIGSLEGRARKPLGKALEALEAARETVPMQGRMQSHYAQSVASSPRFDEGRHGQAACQPVRAVVVGTRVWARRPRSFFRALHARGDRRKFQTLCGTTLMS